MPYDIFRIRNFAGINTALNPVQIEDNESPDMLNIELDDFGAIRKRRGYKRLYPTPFGDGPINGMFLYRKIDGTKMFLVAHGNCLYVKRYDSSPTINFSRNSTAYNIDYAHVNPNIARTRTIGTSNIGLDFVRYEPVYTYMSDAHVHFFTMNDKCYMLNGHEFLVYDGVEIKNVEDDNPYIPTLTLGRTPAGGGTANEQINLLSPGFKDSFSGDGVSTKYQLSLSSLSDDEVTAEVDYAILTEGIDFTVDRNFGIVTFNTPPPQGTNNVIITAYKAHEELADRIRKCTVSIAYGGPNDSRIFLAGNPEFPNYLWRSDVYDPTYWPENNYVKVGADSEKIMNFSMQYDTVIIHKEFSKWNMQYEYNNGNPLFPIKPINDSVGCIAIDSVQTVENNPVALTSNGVYIMTNTAVRDERNVTNISKNIDKLLLKEPNLEKAVSIDYDKKYMLCVNNNLYIYDYANSDNKRRIWYKWDNIPASCFIEIDGKLYFGSNTEGMIYVFKEPGETGLFNDDGNAINAYWKSKLLNFGADEFYKNIYGVMFSLGTDTRSSADLYYTTNISQIQQFDTSEIKQAGTIRMDLFDFANIDFANFSFVMSSLPQEANAPVKAIKTIYFQVMLKNDKIDENMPIMSIGVQYKITKEVR